MILAKEHVKAQLDADVEVAKTKLGKYNSTIIKNAKSKLSDWNTEIKELDKKLK